MKQLGFEQTTLWLENKGLLLELSSRGMWSPRFSVAPVYVVELGLFNQDMNPVGCLDIFLRITMEEWTECCVWRRLPNWMRSDDASLYAELQNALIGGLVHEDVVAAICLDRTERSILHRVLLARMLCNIALADDGFVVPDRGKARFISIDHDEDATLKCVDEAYARLVHTKLLQEELEADIWTEG